MCVIFQRQDPGWLNSESLGIKLNSTLELREEKDAVIFALPIQRLV